MRISRSLFHDHPASRFNDQFIVRLFNGEEVLVISEIVDSFHHDGGFRHNLQFALRKAVTQHRAGLEARNVAADRDGVFVLVRGAVNDFVDHRPMLIGSVRAWLKYLLDKLSDHEGSNRSRPARKFSS